MKNRLLLTLFMLAVAAPAAGQTTADLRADVTANIPDNVTEEVSPADVRGPFLRVADLLDERPTASAASALIASWARATGAVGTIPDAVLPFWLRQANLAVPATWARSIPAPVGRAPLSALPPQLAFIPETDCASGEVWQRGAATWGCAVVSGGGGGGLSTAQVDLRIATWALRNSPTGTAPAARLAAAPAANEFLRAASGGGTDWAGIDDADLPASIARDTELPTIRSDGEIDARVAPWARATPVGNVPLTSIPDLPAARVTSGTFVDARIPSLSASKTTTGTFVAARLAASPATGRFLRATSATATSWGTIADADLPSSIARDTELPAAPAAWARDTGFTGTAPRDRLAPAPAGGFNTGSERYFLATGADANVANVEWVNQIDAQDLDPTGALARVANMPAAVVTPATVIAASPGDCLRRATGSATTISAARLLFEWAACGGGGGSTGLTVRTARPASTVAVDTPADGGASPWTTLATLTIAASEAGAVTVNMTGYAVLTAPTGATPLAGGGDRAHTEFRLRRTRGAATEDVFGPLDVYAPRNAANASLAAYVTATQRVSFSATWGLDAVQSGDVLTLQVMHIGQRDTAPPGTGNFTRRLTWSATLSGLQIVH